ncbi:MULTISPECIES: metallophosphoesterase [unclassified Microbacterium]|uniref:metallophosphoesterase n=1 Tax=unclassified Microbacterium TaxID=2609290 RepID=UPI0024698E80|nr:MULTISPECIES: metallophosphoesterase [unclassified Microbacterium]MDH5131836.1 metallophosphoesterase [Microbacterium sp. RD10]MDH5135641.1 metallophosphoesterase [Microbacterium sp. RD11]MDH5145215.1 metallophosphoesterase [Microbacterium sp. RD12]MDH5153644.1 metallophosphoesterase [Microbacterium sp. RD06]MDH5166240.1 metallophosphoesterase [Microbacterium sp. RD02]
MILTEHPRPSHTFVHISDTHLPGERSPLYGSGADADANLAEMLDRLVASGLRPDALLFTGDLTDRGDAAAYGRLRELVTPAAASLGCEVVWAAGNHDDRRAMRSELGLAGAGDEPIVEVRWFGGMRVIVVDSTVPGAHWGEVPSSQLVRLEGELSTAAPQGTLLLIHHPPLPTVLDLAVTVELRDQDALAAVLRGSDVRGILSGHVHHPSFGTFAGIPVAVASSSAYGQDLAQPVGATRGQDAAQGYNLVHVYADTIVHSAVSLERGADVGEPVAADEAGRRIAGVGIDWRD